jgi:8-oxo-dGTP pyrophosphatase MutT (NUDIX family)
MESLSKQVAAVMLMSPEGRVLMCRRVDDGSWAFPAGGVKDGESFEQAAWRELWEETGYRCGSVGEPYMRRIKDGIDCTTYLVSVEAEFTPRLNHEHTSWMWIKPEEVVALAKAAPRAAKSSSRSADDEFEAALNAPFPAAT